MTRQWNDPKYKEWRIKVYKRSRFKCAVCGSKGRIHAHHLDGWDWAISKRYDPENGVALCTKKRTSQSPQGGCHEKFHAIYGKGANTKQQFEMFKKKYERKNSNR